MKIKKLINLAAGALFLLGSALHAADLSVPEQLIEDTSNEIKLVLNRDRQLLESDPAYVYRLVDEVLVPHVDLNRISALVLGKNWKRATVEQKKTFQHEFKRLLVRTYATALNELDDWQLTFLPSRQGRSENDVMVRSKIERKDGPPVAVDYRMTSRSGDWKVYDVKIEGMSLVTNYRSSFNRLVRTTGMDGLLAHMVKTNNEKLVVSNDEAVKAQKIAHNGH